VSYLERTIQERYSRGVIVSITRGNTQSRGCLLVCQGEVFCK
jgi:hypothetical protein